MKSERLSYKKRIPEYEEEEGLIEGKWRNKVFYND